MAKTLDQELPSATRRVLIYGAPKTGKTELAGRLAEKFNLIWFDLENGHKTLLKFPLEWKQRIQIINIPDTRTYPMAIETCLKVVKATGDVEICDTHGKVDCMLCKREYNDEIKNEDESFKEIHYDSYFTKVNLHSLPSNTIVVFDSLTQLTNSAIAHMTKNEPDDYKLSWDDWGNLGKLLEIFLSHIQQANYSVICISHEVEAETEGKKKTLVPVAGSRNYSRNVAKFFDDVIYCEKKNGRHNFASSTLYATNIMAGSRASIEIEAEEVPSLNVVFDPDYTPTIKALPNSKTTSGNISKNSSIGDNKGGAVKASELLAKMKAGKK